MPTLSSLLVHRQIASMREVEEAIERQVLHGGDLVTNLLEMAPDREAALGEVLAESLGLPLAAAGRLPPPEQAALVLVSSELALRHAIFPLLLEGDALLLATSEPLSRDAHAELGAAIGRPLHFAAAPYLRVREGIAAHYGVPLERRLVKLVARLDGLRAPPGTSTRPPPVRRRADPVIRIASEQPSEIGLGSAPPPPFGSAMAEVTWAEDRETVPTGLPEGIREISVSEVPMPEEGSSRPPPTTAGELARWLHRVADAERRARARPPRRKGPLAVGEAEEQIEEARTAEGVLDGFFAFASQYFEYSALFGVRGDLAEGHDAWGPGTPRDAVVAIGVPLELPSCFARVRERRAPLLERIPETGLDREILSDLGRLERRVTRGASLLVPVVVRGRTLAILIGDDGPADVDLEGLGPVISLSHRAAAALERLVLERKRAGARASSAPRASVVGRARTAVFGGASRGPDRERAAAALVSALDENGAERGSFAPGPPEHGAEGLAAAAGASPAVEDLQGPATDPYLGPPLDDPFELPPPARDEEEPHLHHRHHDDRREGGPSHDDRREDEEEDELPPAERPLPPSSVAPIYPSSRPSRRSGQLPRPEHASLLHRAARGGPDGEAAREELAQEARISMGALMTHFPGPLSVDRLRSRQELPRASGCGVLLALLADAGRAALPFITTRASSPDEDQRFWATHLLAELPFPEAATAVVPRLFDEDVAVRRVARRTAAVLLLHGLPDDPIAQALESIARTQEEPSARRALAIETMGELRVERLVAPLLRLLEDEGAAVPAVARRALTILTKQDFLLDVEAWTTWWIDNRQHHRVEWLIDALTHEQPTLRRAAADELKQITQEYFGYYDDLPPRERERAQSRYRDWWEREGQLKFY